MINTIQTYGKINPIKRFCLELRTAFKGNDKSRDYFSNIGVETYRPRLKRKFWFSLVISGVLISPIVPAGFIGAFPLIKWGLR